LGDGLVGVVVLVVVVGEVVLVGGVEVYVRLIFLPVINFPPQGAAASEVAGRGFFAIPTANSQLPTANLIRAFPSFFGSCCKLILHML
jgi:hypothetical protein